MAKPIQPRTLAICATFTRRKGTGDSERDIVGDLSAEHGIQRPAIWKALRSGGVLPPFAPRIEGGRGRPLGGGEPGYTERRIAHSKHAGMSREERVEALRPATLEPCRRCGVRADIGCRHQPAEGPPPLAIERSERRRDGPKQAERDAGQDWLSPHHGARSRGPETGPFQQLGQGIGCALHHEGIRAVNAPFQPPQEPEALRVESVHADGHATLTLYLSRPPTDEEIRAFEETPPAPVMLHDVQAYAARMQVAELVVRLFRFYILSNLVLPDTPAAMDWLGSYLDGNGGHGPLGSPLKWPALVGSAQNVLTRWGYCPSDAGFVAKIP